MLFDRGHVSTPEPFRKLVNQGMILGEAELTAYKVTGLDFDAPANISCQHVLGDWVSSRDAIEVEEDDGSITYKTSAGAKLKAVRLSPEQVVKQGDAFVLKDQPAVVVESRAVKMSKSRGNVVNPDDVVSQYGADSLRLYEMFMGPLEQVKPWQMSGVEGVYRFLGRVWRMIVDERADNVTLNAAVQDVALTDEQQRVLHKTIKAVTEDIDKLSFNTAISRMMEFTNVFTQEDVRPQFAMEQLVLLLSPFAPHMAEELWEVLGHAETLAYHPWPEHDESLLIENEVEIPVQINGKLRAKIRVPVDAKPQAMQEIAEASDDVQKQLAGKPVVKDIAVPGRKVNYVVKG